MHFKEKEFKTFFQLFLILLVIRMIQVNIVQAENETIQNQTLMSGIDTYLSSTITNAQQIYQAYLNGSLTYELFSRHFYTNYRDNIFTEFLPTYWFQPEYIMIQNNGWMDSQI